MNEKRGGRQGGVENVKLFKAWRSERDRAEDWADYIHRGQLNRSEIAKECGFALSSFRSNPALKSALDDVEAKLRERGAFAISKHVQNVSDSTPENRATQAVEHRIMIAKHQTDLRIKSLEEQNATLRAEVRDLREEMKRFNHLDAHLCRTGRLLHK
jgi:uncharacterized protein YeeX (DUF496 family)